MLNQARNPLKLRRPAGLNARFMASAGSVAAAAAAAPAVTMADVVKLLGDIQNAHKELRDKNDARLAALEKGKGDVVADEQVTRISADVVAMQKIMDEFSAQMTAQRMGAAGAADSQASSDVRAHRDAFRAWFCYGRGEEALRNFEVKAALSTDSKPDGGFVVPEEVEAAITRAIGTVSVIQRLATVRTISTGNYKKLHGLGGATHGWVGEKASRPETNTPTLSELDFPVLEMYAMPGATQNILDDARIDIGGWLGDEVQITFAEQEGAAFVTGDGNAKPRGVTSYTKIANASYAWGKTGFVVTGVAAALSDGSNNGVDGLKRLKYALKAAYLPGATFVMNRNTAYAVSILKDSDGNYLWQPSVQVGEPSILLGHPVEQDDNFVDPGSATYPVAFGDFKRGYVVVDRSGITVLRDPYTNKPYVMFYTTKRVGGGIQDFDAIKLLKCST